MEVTMTVRELIERLQELPPESTVYAEHTVSTECYGSREEEFECENVYEAEPGVVRITPYVAR
jgi:hypothetical protein